MHLNRFLSKGFKILCFINQFWFRSVSGLFTHLSDQWLICFSVFCKIRNQEQLTLACFLGGYLLFLENKISVRTRKRKASVDRETNKKRHRGSSKNPTTCQPRRVSTEDVRARLSKRKASPDPEVPEKRQRVGSKTKAATTSTSQPQEVLVEDVEAGQPKQREEDSNQRQSSSQNTPPEVYTSRGKLVV